MLLCLAADMAPPPEEEGEFRFSLEVAAGAVSLRAGSGGEGVAVTYRGFKLVFFFIYYFLMP